MQTGLRRHRWPNRRLRQAKKVPKIVLQPQLLTRLLLRLLLLLLLLPQLQQKHLRQSCMLLLVLQKPPLKRYFRQRNASALTSNTTKRCVGPPSLQILHLLKSLLWHQQMLLLLRQLKKVQLLQLLALRLL